jgi:hypothetical protein
MRASAYKRSAQTLQNERDGAEPQPKPLGLLGWLQILGGSKKRTIMANVFGAKSTTDWSQN